MNVDSLYGGLVTQSCLTLATPWTVAYQSPLSMGFPRQEYMSGLPSLGTWNLGAELPGIVSDHVLHLPAASLSDKYLTAPRWTGRYPTGPARQTPALPSVLLSSWSLWEFWEEWWEWEVGEGLFHPKLGDVMLEDYFLYWLHMYRRNSCL